jgi:hypothetical protein
MVFEDNLADTVNGTLYRRQLNEDFTAVTAIFHHALDGFQVADKPRHAIEHRLGMRMGMRMSMRTMMVMVVIMGMRNHGAIF